MVDELIVGSEDAVGEPIVAEELPDVFDRVELGAFRRQRNDGDVCRHDKTGRQVPTGLIDQEDGVVVGRIMKAAAKPADASWLWTLAYGYHEDRTPTHGYEPTREAAMAAFAKSWRRE